MSAKRTVYLTCCALAVIASNAMSQSIMRPSEFVRNVSMAVRYGNNDTHASQGPSIESKKTIVTRSMADSSRKESSIKAYSLSDDNNQLKLWLSLTEEQVVDISVYNILGKKVKDLDHTSFSEGDMKEVVYTVRDIPNGVYIVAAQGSNFRSAIRIVISR